MPKAALRVWAWIAGVLAFLAPWSALNAHPKPDSTLAARPRVRQVRPVIVRKVVRRVIVVETVPRVIHLGATYSGGGSTSGGSSGNAPATITTKGGGGGGGGAPPPAPPPPPPVKTGGS
jgi:uncharacterized membrane protein YgcG